LVSKGVIALMYWQYRIINFIYKFVTKNKFNWVLGDEKIDERVKAFLEVEKIKFIRKT